MIRVLARRLLLAIVLWVAVLLGFRAFVTVWIEFAESALVGATARAYIPWDAMTYFLVASPALGWATGWFFARDLVKQVRFAGWIPRGLALAATLVAIALPTVGLWATLPRLATGTWMLTAGLGASAASVAILLGTRSD